MPDLRLTGEALWYDTEPPERLIRVHLANETEPAVDAGRIEAAVRAAFARSAYESVEVSVAIVDDPTIHRLNRQFLDHDYPTDVLSFALEDNPPRLEGEVIVSADTAQRCALEAGWSAADELLLYVIHGALHLAGYRDKSRENSAEMRAAELATLAELGVKPSAGNGRWHAAAAEDEAP